MAVINRAFHLSVKEKLETVHSRRETADSRSEVIQEWRIDFGERPTLALYPFFGHCEGSNVLGPSPALRLVHNCVPPSKY